jgi:hypothetical protein
MLSRYYAGNAGGTSVAAKSAPYTQGKISDLRERVGDAVTALERRRMAALAESKKSGPRDGHLFGIEGTISIWLRRSVDPGHANRWDGRRVRPRPERLCACSPQRSSTIRNHCAQQNISLGFLTQDRDHSRGVYGINAEDRSRRKDRLRLKALMLPDRRHFAQR